jgi:uncharacterized membrane protein YhaH (DUF805 family)
MSFSTILFSFTGRLNRAPYWLASAAVVVAVLICIGIAVAIDLATSAMVVLFLPLFVALIWITLALAIKRLHERDKSAWCVLMFYFAPSILQAIGQDAGSTRSTRSTRSILMMLIGTGISIWGFVELGCLRGTAGQNSYGPDPLQVR